MNSRCPKLAHGHNNKQNTEKSKQNREQKPFLKLQFLVTSHDFLFFIKEKFFKFGDKTYRKLHCYTLELELPNEKFTMSHEVLFAHYDKDRLRDFKHELARSAA